MTSQRSLAALAAVAALIAAGCASSGTNRGAGKPVGGAKAPPAKAADPKAAPSSGAPAAKGAEGSAAPGAGSGASGAPADGAAAPAAAAETAPASGGGFWASYDDFMKRTNNKLKETKFLGMKVVPNFKDEIAFTDNVYYQDANEKLVVDRDPEGDNILAQPNLGTPRGEVSDIVNTATLGVDLEMPLNLALVPLVGMGSDKVKVLSAEITSVEYLVHPDSPDALNWAFHGDLPYLINDMLSHLMKVDAARNAFYVRFEGDYAVTSDPLDVAKLDFNSTNPTFTNGGDRNSFKRTEWWMEGTMGWKGPIFDSKISYRKYRLQLEDNSLKPADHYEDEAYAEVGHHLKRSEHRVYGFYEYTKYNFDNRGNVDPTNPQNDNTAALRDFGKIRTGLGWEGPLGSKRIRGGAELYYIATDVYHKGPYYNYPTDITIGTGGAVVDKNGNVQKQAFDEANMMAGKANLAYRPFVTKGTQLQADYERDVEWSVVAQDKIVDNGTITFTHPVNDRLTAEAFTGVTMENMQHREKRLYTEIGLGGRYKIAAFTELSLRYSLRHMRSRHEPVTTQADAANEPYLIKADGDFTANIVSLGVTIEF